MGLQQCNQQTQQTSYAQKWMVEQEKAQLHSIRELKNSLYCEQRVKPFPYK